MASCTTAVQYPRRGRNRLRGDIMIDNTVLMCAIFDRIRVIIIY